MLKERVELLQELIRELSQETLTGLVLVYTDEDPINKFEIITFTGQYSVTKRNVFVGNKLLDCYNRLSEKPKRSKIDTWS